MINNSKNASGKCNIQQIQEYRNTWIWKGEDKACKCLCLFSFPQRMSPSSSLASSSTSPSSTLQPPAGGEGNNNNKLASSNHASVTSPTSTLESRDSGIIGQMLYSLFNKKLSHRHIINSFCLSPPLSSSHVDQLFCWVSGRAGRWCQAPWRRLPWQQPQPLAARGPVGGGLQLLFLYGSGGTSERWLPIQGGRQHGRVHLQPQQAPPGPRTWLRPLIWLHPLHPSLPHASAQFCCW